MVDVEAENVGEGGERVMTVAAGTSRPTSDTAMRHCQEITRRRARNFYYGLKLSPEPQRSALFAIYAWMRAADDIVDGMIGNRTESAMRELDDFRNQTDAALAGDPASDPLWIALATVARDFRISPEHFHGMLDGQLDDLHRGEHETFEQLRNYCYRVASTVGLICIEIWGYTDDAARDLAIDRGIAFQLTNIIRDYKQDFDSGRVYLPREDFERHGIDPQTMREWSKPIACHTMMMQQVQRASQFYDRSTGLENFIKASCRPTLWAMTRIYRGLLDKISRNPSKVVLTKRLRLSAWKKGAIALQARWQLRSTNQRSGHVRTVSEA